MYVSDLEQAHTYLQFMRDSKEAGEAGTELEIPMPDDLKQGKDRMVFANLENIFEWHRE